MVGWLSADWLVEIGQSGPCWHADVPTSQWGRQHGEPFQTRFSDPRTPVARPSDSRILDTLAGWRAFARFLPGFYVDSRHSAFGDFARLGSSWRPSSRPLLPASFTNRLAVVSFTVSG
ncbi:unnamed protein product [Protopolystoma xenopodis]|uniref:Uncharacterized protein n=1 Tax=Protopolystoma xenopodis TaxID=117903 RepID=A0A3S5AVS1_9PLAT|nr:unnamed protein product [Protopolystoma xenopodis]